MQPSVLIFGAGAVGATLANWLAPELENLSVFDRPEVLDVIEEKGIGAYAQDLIKEVQWQKVKVVRDLSTIPAPDIILLCVKNYSLESVCSSLTSHFGDAPLVVGLQNGRDNQRVLPQYFSKVAYGVVCYNAWLDSPNVVGYQKRGPLVLGRVGKSCSRQCLEETINLLHAAVPCFYTAELEDAVISKMIINLTNSLTSLVGLGFEPLDDEDKFQKILTGLTYEGVCIARAAGYKEARLGGMPSWATMGFAAKAPTFLTRPIFRRNLKKMVVSSMAQDLLTHKRPQTELESINGELLALAYQHGVDAPLNQALYKLCKSEFSKSGFKPLSAAAVYQSLFS
ncbi:2-dehydropantoate 2-reductase [Aliiglaciecola sp. CAU 1673]|uniref:ketopantoate reductase family protein n=1 Tax=Aliiglaciecola sp. CAU 1673 TaxID=3032595 RepID=UPI0023DC6E2E|nr:2-dehydropantoate 2-reductase [Aliiglaciecola sp. CAU 1673]MDF2179301.1 2-dehydropantoate 2-reductase [Aliiglaciecola sp. CAU 1673]